MAKLYQHQRFWRRCITGGTASAGNKQWPQENKQHCSSRKSEAVVTSTRVAPHPINIQMPSTAEDLPPAICQKAIPYEHWQLVVEE